jgi:hypothetical protein
MINIKDKMAERLDIILHSKGQYGLINKAPIIIYDRGGAFDRLNVKLDTAMISFNIWNTMYQNNKK